MAGLTALQKICPHWTARRDDDSRLRLVCDECSLVFVPAYLTPDLPTTLLDGTDPAAPVAGQQR